MTPSLADLQKQLRQDGRLTLVLKVRTKCGRHGLSLDKNGRLTASLRQAAENGKANAELLELLSASFDTALDNIKILSGRTGPRKTINLRL